MTSKETNEIKLNPFLFPDNYVRLVHEMLAKDGGYSTADTHLHVEDLGQVGNNVYRDLGKGAIVISQNTWKYFLTKALTDEVNKAAVNETDTNLDGCIQLCNGDLPLPASPDIKEGNWTSEEDTHTAVKFWAARGYRLIIALRDVEGELKKVPFLKCIVPPFIEKRVPGLAVKTKLAPEQGGMAFTADIAMMPNSREHADALTAVGFKGRGYEVPTTSIDDELREVAQRAFAEWWDLVEAKAAVRNQDDALGKIVARMMKEHLIEGGFAPGGQKTLDLRSNRLKPKDIPRAIAAIGFFLEAMAEERLGLTLRDRNGGVPDSIERSLKVLDDDGEANDERFALPA